MVQLIIALLLSCAFIPTVFAYQIEIDSPIPSQRTRRETIENARQQTQLNAPHEQSAKEQTTQIAKEEKGYPLEVVYDNSDYFTFGAQVTMKNTLDGSRISYVSQSSEHSPLIQPGTYRAFTEASRKGFPQEAKYQIIDVLSGNIVEEFPRTHVGVNNLVLEKGQKLRIVVLPATRPYNSTFFRIGKRRTPAAIIFNRPYPIYDFDPGEFGGPDQFSSTQISIAFWGMKRAYENPALAKEIEQNGVSGLRNGDTGRIYDPVLVLGVREVAKDLAETFVKDRTKNVEDSRGKYHVAFLIQRTPQGKTPRALLAMTVDELEVAIEKQILWMEMHNVHRPNEGGGYADETFLEVIEEAKKKALLWPVNSFRSTELEHESVRELEGLAARDGLDATVTLSSGTTGVARQLLQSSIERLLNAIGRERKNDETYEAEWLHDVEQAMGITVSKRIEILKADTDVLTARLKALQNEVPVR